MIETKALYERYKKTVARVTMRKANGDLVTGTAFHIGDGWLVTAAHVISVGVIEEVVPEYGVEPLTIVRVIPHSNPRVDLALMETDFDANYRTMVPIGSSSMSNQPVDHITVGGHLDDWMGDSFVLSKVLLMGYPPISFSQGPVLVATEGEVNAVVDKYDGPHPHFVVSCIGRGGFSGGPVLSEYGFLLGVLTESLVANDQPAEMGYSAAVSVEPLLALLHENKIYPATNRKTLEVLFDGDRHWDDGHKPQHLTATQALYHWLKLAFRKA